MEKGGLHVRRCTNRKDGSPVSSLWGRKLERSFGLSYPQALYLQPQRNVEPSSPQDHLKWKKLSMIIKMNSTTNFGCSYGYEKRPPHELSNVIKRKSNYLQTTLLLKK